MKIRTVICTTPINHLEGLKNRIKKYANLIYEPELNAKKLRNKLIKNKKIDTIFCNPNRQGYILDKSILKNTSVNLINTASTGLNHINLDDCKKLKIKILSLTKDMKLINKLPSTSELAFGIMLSLLKNINSSFNDVKKKKWDYSKHIGQEIASLTIGLIGLGRLGNYMAKFAKAFGMKIIYYDPFKTSNKYKKVSLNKIFKTSDVISIHTHVNKNTKYLINKKILKLVKKKPLIINTSRGEIVNEKDLIWALKRKMISGYGTDVIETEFDNIQKSPIIKNINKYNIIVTPHIGGMTRQGQLRAFSFAVEKFRYF